MSQTTMIAMLEEAEDVLRRAGCDVTADKVRGVLQAQQAEPRCACGDSFTSDAVCANCLAAQQQAEPVALEPVEGDLLPAIGDTVLIHLSRPDGWFPHRVVGYYAWGDLRGSKHLYRVFVRVVDAEGYPNARPLDAIRRLGDETAQPPAVAVPDGYALVPVEPTEEMLAAGQQAWLNSAGADPSFDIYRAMLAVQKGGA